MIRCQVGMCVNPVKKVSMNLQEEKLKNPSSGGCVHSLRKVSCKPL